MTATPHSAETDRGPSPLRAVVMGTGPFAVPMFRALLASPHHVAAVVTRPDRTAPGRRPPPNPMREAAVAAQIPILAPENVNAPDALSLVAHLAPDLLVVCDYGQILAPATLGVAPLGGINLHGSLLPRHRGAAPVQWAILEGDAVTGVSVIQMTPALDAGGVIAARSTPIGPRETAPELEARLADLGAAAVLEAIDLLRAGGSAREPSAGAANIAPQDPARVTRAPRLTKADGVVDWSHPAARIERMRRALEPWPRATTFFRRDGAARRLVLADVCVADAVPPAGSRPGTVLGVDDNGIVVACGGDTSLVITHVVPEGRRGMTAAEFARGNAIHAGILLG